MKIIYSVKLLSKHSKDTQDWWKSFYLRYIWNEKSFIHDKQQIRKEFYILISRLKWKQMEKLIKWDRRHFSFWAILLNVFAFLRFPGYVDIQLSLNLPLVTTQHLLNCKDPYIQEFMCWLQVNHGSLQHHPHYWGILFVL